MSGRNLQTRLTDFGSDIYYWSRDNIVIIISTLVIIAFIVGFNYEGFKAMSRKKYHDFPLGQDEEKMSFVDMFKNILMGKKPKEVSVGNIGTVMEEDPEQLSEEEVILEEEHAPTIAKEMFRHR